MDIPTHINSFFTKSKSGILRVDAEFLKDLSYYKKKYQSFGKIIDFLGKKSSDAQGLGTTITTFSKVRITKNVIFLSYSKHPKTNKACVVGLLKIGKKKLFIRDSFGQFHELTPLCVLDFYVHENFQRKGIGKKLFEYMLNGEGSSPEDLGYDRPSIKLKKFLMKHYDLQDYIEQSNNFVVFNRYFEKKMENELKKDNYYKSVSHSPLKVDEKMNEMKKRLFFSKTNKGNK